MSPLLSKYCASLLLCTLCVTSLGSPLLFAETSEDTDTPRSSAVENEILIKYRDDTVNLRTADGQEIASDITESQ